MTYTRQLLYLSVGLKLTPWSRGLLKKLTVSQLAKKFPHFMEPGDSKP
jgi:hypothetical protein